MNSNDCTAVENKRSNGKWQAFLVLTGTSNCQTKRIVSVCFNCTTKDQLSNHVMGSSHNHFDFGSGLGS